MFQLLFFRSSKLDRNASCQTSLPGGSLISVLRVSHPDYLVLVDKLSEGFWYIRALIQALSGHPPDFQ
jgi:hypothetical protein